LIDIMKIIREVAKKDWNNLACNKDVRLSLPAMEANTKDGNPDSPEGDIGYPACKVPY
jgi:hypothetical protein